MGSIEYVTLVSEGSGEDVGEVLLREGLVLAENRKERRLQKLVSEARAPLPLSPSSPSPLTLSLLFPAEGVQEC